MTAAYVLPALIPPPCTPAEETRLTRTARPHPHRDLAHQAAALVALRPTAPANVQQTHRALLQLARQARAARATLQLERIRMQMAVFRAHVHAYRDELARQSMKLKRNPTGTDPVTQELTRLWLPGELPVITWTPAREPLAVQDRARDLERQGANALAHALWGVQHGTREWTALPTRPPTTTAPRPDPGSSTPGAAYLEVTVHSLKHATSHRLRLYRDDYQRLLKDWGYARVLHAAAARDRLKGSVSNADLDALYDLAATGPERQPNLARAWHAYVTGGRLGDVFTPHAASGTLQLASNRSGDLREAALQIHALARLLPAPTPPE